MHKKLSFLFLLGTIVFTSCTEDRVFEQNRDFEQSIWPIGEKAQFDFEIADNSKYYQLLLNLRHDLNYPYRNMYVYYQLKDTTNYVMDKALVNFQLFTDKEGKPIGTGTSNIITYQEVLIDSMQFPYGGKFSIDMEQYMRTDSLSGVYSAGLKIIEQPNSAE